MKIVALLLLALVSLSGCSHDPAVKQQAYANLKSQHTYEYDLPTVWKGIESALHNYKIVDRDPSDVGIMEMKKLTKRTLETDWIYAQSRDKYIEYKVNDSPRKQYLQTRIKYYITAQSQIGGTDVSVRTKEEIERLKSDGSPDGYEAPEKVDPSRAAEMLDKIGLAILSAAP